MRGHTFFTVALVKIQDSSADINTELNQIYTDISVRKTAQSVC